jgi:anti-sigma factor ChrR (cupin superfamily)
MPRFSKRHDCPSSEVLRAHGAGTLSPLPRAGVGAHRDSCDFCGAESQLLARAVGPFEATPAPEMPLALRLFAEGRLAQVAAAAAFKNLRAA